MSVCVCMCGREREKEKDAIERKESKKGNVPGGPVAKTPAPNARGLGLIPGQRTKIPHVRACVLSCFSHVRLFATLWTVALQALLSMGFSRQEYCRALPQGIFLTQEYS